MLARPHRLRDGRVLRTVTRRGRTFRTPNLLMHVMRSTTTTNRFAFVVSTKVSKSAVVRNRIRRQLQGLVRRHHKQLPTSVDVLLRVVPQQPRPTTSTIERDFSTLLSQLK